MGRFLLVVMGLLMGCSASQEATVADASQGSDVDSVALNDASGGHEVSGSLDATRPDDAGQTDSADAPGVQDVAPLPDQVSETVADLASGPDPVPDMTVAEVPLEDLGPQDKDEDGVVDGEDNCPEVFNDSQTDLDDDGLGDPCDDDIDGDGLANIDDNCPEQDNEGQADADDDGMGDLCDPDDDNDGVPDIADEAPLDADWPGLAIDGAIYAHTSSSLYRYDPEQQAVTKIGDFGFPNLFGEMTDIAIDYEGRLFGVSFSDLFRCSAVTAECIQLGGLPSSFNGMTIVPAGTINPGEESMIGIGNSGSWNLITVVGNQASITNLGSYGPGYSSAGDAYSIEGIGTFAAVNKAGQSSTWLVKVDPAVGTVIEEIGPMTGYTQIYGLASDGETAYAFDASGAILALDVLTGDATISLPASQGPSWWGAGVTTRYFNKE